MKHQGFSAFLSAALVVGGGVAVGADVVVTPGFDYTNVVIRVDGALGAEVSVVDSANAAVAPFGPLAPASAYAYDVRQGGVSIASGAFATGHDEAAAEGEWLLPPLQFDDGHLSVNDEARMYFARSPSNRVTRTDMKFLFDGFIDTTTLAAPDGGFAGITAVTNSAADRVEWRAWNGSWIVLDGPVPRPDVEYSLRVLIDFKHTAPRVCYLLSEDGGNTYVVLRHEGNAWIESASSAADRVSTVKFKGGMELADLTHRAIDGTDTARFIGEGGAETAGSLAEALAYSPLNAITLLTNVTWPEDGPKSGEWLFDMGGHSLANVPDGVTLLSDLSTSLEFVCNPNKLRWSGSSNADIQSRMMSSMHVRSNLIYTSGGEWTENKGPCPIWAVDPVSGFVFDDYDAASERIDYFVEDSAGRLYAPCIDQNNDPERGSFFRKGLDGTWQAMKVWPNVTKQFSADDFDSGMISQGYAIHTWGLSIWKGRVFTAGYGIAWGEVGSDAVMSNATTCLTSPNRTVEIVTNGVTVGTVGGHHYHRFRTFLPFEDDLFCLPYNFRYYYDPSVSGMEVWRFDEGSGQFVCSTNEWSEVAPGLENWSGTFFPISPVRFAGRTLYLMDTESSNAPDPWALCSAVAENHRIRAQHVDLGGMWPQSIIVRGDVVSVLTWKTVGGKIMHTVWESTDGLSFRRRLVFYSDHRMTAFAYHDGCYYFGVGWRPEGGFLYLDSVAGDIYRLRDPALARQVAVEAESESLTVAEGGRGVARFRLNARPSGTVTAAVRAARGVPALLPAVSEVVFTPEDWNEWHEVPFAVEDDRIDIVRPGAIVCGGEASQCRWAATRVEIGNNDVRVVETPPDGLLDLTRPDGDYSVSALSTSGSIKEYRVIKVPFSDDTTLTNWTQCLRVKSRPACNVDYDFGEPTVVNAYGIWLSKSGYSTTTSAPRMWTFSGSNDGVTWRELDSRSCETGWKNGEYRYYSFRNRRAYRKYRITFIHDGNTCAPYMRLSHLEYYCVPQPEALFRLILR